MEWRGEKMINELAKKLRLPYLREESEDFIQEANAMNLTPQETLELALDRELRRREDNSQKRRIKDARFQYKKYLTDYDYSVFSRETRNKLKELEDLTFINKQENAILIGNPGTGKTHFAIGLGIEACIKGYSVLFANAPNLVIQLKEEVARSQYVRFKTRFEKADLVIIDELGYISFDEVGSELLFNLLSNRNNKGSLLITTNLTFDGWEECFVNSTLAGALVDRLAYKAHVVDMRGDSYRVKQTSKWLEKAT